MGQKLQVQIIYSHWANYYIFCSHEVIERVNFHELLDERVWKFSSDLYEKQIMGN